VTPVDFCSGCARFKYSARTPTVLIPCSAILG
jgi:hypothetical protein